MKKVVLIGAGLFLLMLSASLLLLTSRAGNKEGEIGVERSPQSKKSEGQKEQSTRSLNYAQMKASSFWTKESREKKFKVADIDLPLSFEQEVEEELIQVILADFELVFGHLDSHNYFKPRQPKRVKLDGEDIGVNKGIQPSGERAFRPAQLDQTILVYSSDGEERVVISKEIISAYRKAWKLRNANFTAYNQLEKFLSNLNQATVENPIEVSAKDLFWTPDDTIVSLDEYPNIVQSYSSLTVRMPSILEIREMSEFLESSDALLLVKSFNLNLGSDVPQNHTSLVYHNGKWKFVYGALGT